VQVLFQSQPELLKSLKKKHELTASNPGKHELTAPNPWRILPPRPWPLFL
jgi:hypothetical protein